MNLVLRLFHVCFITSRWLFPLAQLAAISCLFLVQLHDWAAAWLRPSPRVVACDLTERPLGQQLVDSDNRRLSALTLGYDISRCEGVLPSPRRVSASHSLHGRGLLPHAPPCRGAPVLPVCRVLECSPRRGCGRANSRLLHKL